MKLLLLSVVLLSVACAPPAHGPGPATTTGEDATVSDLPVSGTAANAKGGAVLQADDGRVIYVIGLDSWSDDLLGKRVTATGKLNQRKHIPDPVVADDGAISQGAEGDQWVLDDAKWALAK